MNDRDQNLMCEIESFINILTNINRSFILNRIKKFRRIVLFVSTFTIQTIFIVQERLYVMCKNKLIIHTCYLSSYVRKMIQVFMATMTSESWARAGTRAMHVNQIMKTFFWYESLYITSPSITLISNIPQRNNYSFSRNNKKLPT